MGWNSMMTLLSHYWGWLAAIFGLGLLGALSAHHDDTSSGRPVWLGAVAALLGAGGVADLLHLLSAPAALGVETAIASSVAFVAGALAGGGGRMRGLWWGPFVVAALVWLCSNALLGQEKPAEATLAPIPPPPVAAPVLPAAATATLADKKAAAIAAAKALPESGPLSAAQCQTSLAGLIAGENVKFDTGSAKISADSQALIGKIGATLARCAETRIEVAGYTDATGDETKNKALSQRRAEAVAEMLKAGGATTERLTAVGYGADKPIASNDTDEGRSENRRIEFTVK
jgi:outer membrane protein OmpA-like peptidoglycan-associated protein